MKESARGRYAYLLAPTYDDTFIIQNCCNLHDSSICKEFSNMSVLKGDGRPRCNHSRVVLLRVKEVLEAFKPACRHRRTAHRLFCICGTCGNVILTKVDVLPLLMPSLAQSFVTKAAITASFGVIWKYRLKLWSRRITGIGQPSNISSIEEDNKSHIEKSQCVGRGEDNHQLSGKKKAEC